MIIPAFVGEANPTGGGLGLPAALPGTLPIATESIAACAQTIRAGGLVGLPTETVYGLGGYLLPLKVSNEGGFESHSGEVVSTIVINVLS